MLCREVMDVIERGCPKRYALEWDNVGLLAGRDDREVKRIYVALDATDEVVREAVSWGADMLVTHHPLIFGGLRQITNGDFIGRRLLELIRGDIAYYAAHTNYDVARMGELSAGFLKLVDQEVLELTCEEETEGIGRVGSLQTSVSLREFCEEVKRVFQLETVRVFGEPDSEVRRAAICPGSGKSAIKAALRKQADVLVTGDIGHHEGIDAVAQGLAVADAGHYGIEHIFIEDMRRYLLEHLENVEVIGAPVRHPFASI